MSITQIDQEIRRAILERQLLEHVVCPAVGDLRRRSAQIVQHRRALHIHMLHGGPEINGYAPWTDGETLRRCADPSYEQRERFAQDQKQRRPAPPSSTVCTPSAGTPARALATARASSHVAPLTSTMIAPPVFSHGV